MIAPVLAIVAAAAVAPDAAATAQLEALKARCEAVITEFRADMAAGRIRMGGGSMARNQALQRDLIATLRRLAGPRGWPGVARLGPRGAVLALDLANRVHDPGFKRWAGERIVAADLAGDLPADRRRAQTVDGLLVAMGKPQRYGTALDLAASGEAQAWRPAAIADPASLAARRAALGLQPLADELSAWDALAPLTPIPGGQEPDRRAALLSWLEAHDWLGRVPADQQAAVRAAMRATGTPFVAGDGRSEARPGETAWRLSEGRVVWVTPGQAFAIQLLARIEGVTN